MRNKSRDVLIVIFLASLLLTTWHFRSYGTRYLHNQTGGPTSEETAENDEWPSPGDKVLVMAKMKDENVDWVAEQLPDWQHVIYHMDEPESALHPPMNKGREAMAYLSYIIDNYHKLALTMAFIHPHEGGWPAAWHTDTPDYSNVESLNSLKLEYIQEAGYANLRCVHKPGCPVEIQPFRDPFEEHRTAEHAMSAAWIYMFGGDNSTVPAIISQPCCSQFAVSRDQVQKRRWSDYVKYRQWLIDTPLDDAASGRVLEYLWHIFFGKDPVYCLDLQTCYCKQFGRC